MVIRPFANGSEKGLLEVSFCRASTTHIPARLHAFRVTYNLYDRVIIVGVISAIRQKPYWQKYGRRFSCDSPRSSAVSFLPRGKNAPACVYNSASTTEFDWRLGVVCLCAVRCVLWSRAPLDDLSRFFILLTFRHYMLSLPRPGYLFLLWSFSLSSLDIRYPLSRSPTLGPIERHGSISVTPLLTKLLIYNLFNQINERVDPHLYDSVQLFMVYGNRPKRTGVGCIVPRSATALTSRRRGAARRCTALTTFSLAKNRDNCAAWGIPESRRSV